MNRPSRTKVGNLILVAGLVGLVRPAAADPRPILRIAVLVSDDAGVRPDVVGRAELEISRIYRYVGIDIAWTQNAPDRILVIISRQSPGRLPVAETALGAAIATPEDQGRTAYIFYDRVERVTQTYLHGSIERRDTYDVVMLAHVMAHELGHLLLPYGHSATGLMRADWNAKDLRLAADGRLNFTSEQAELIRGGLLTQVAR